MTHSRAREIKALDDLEVNWDGDGALPISATVLRRTDTLIETIEALGIAAPSPVPCSDGSVELEWVKPALIIAVNPDGTAEIWWEGEE